MTPMLLQGLLVGCAMGGWGYLAAPVPKEKPVLKCEVRWTGKVETTISGQSMTRDVPDAAEVTITNISQTEVDIGSKWGPQAFLDLRVKDPSGADVKTEPLASLLTVQSLSKPKPYILKPGEVYRCSVGLLSMVPEEKLVAGTYKVKAVYTFKKKEYTSADVEVKWPGHKK